MTAQTKTILIGVITTVVGGLLLDYLRDRKKEKLEKPAPKQQSYFFP